MMAGPGGREVGRVSVRVLPDTSSFGRSLERYLQRMERSLRVEIPVSLDQGDVARAAAELDVLTRDRRTEVKVDVDRSAVDRIGQSLAGITKGAGGAGGGIGGFGKTALPVIAAIAAAAPIIIGLFASLPGIIAGIAAPLGAVLLGMDGIKKAAASLAAPFAALRSTISGVFEQGLTPVFERLTRIFPTLQRGLSQVAGSLTNVFSVFVNQLTSGKGLAQVGALLSNIALSFNRLAPAVAPLTDALLTLAVQGTAAFARFAPQLTQTVVSFNRLIQSMARSGELAAAFRSLGTVLTALVRIFGIVVIAGLRQLAMLQFYAAGIRRVAVGIIGPWVAAARAISAAFARISGAARGASNPFQALRRVVSTVASAVIGLVRRMAAGVAAGFSSMVSRAVGIARTLPGRAAAAVQGLVGRLRSIATAAMRALGSALTAGVSRAVSIVRSLPGRCAAAVGNLSGVLFSAGASLVSGFVSGMLSKLGSVASAAGSIAGKVRGFFPGSPVKEGPLTSWNNGGAGQRLAQMLAEGLTSGVPTVAGAAGALASSANASLSTSATAGGAAAGSGHKALEDVIAAAVEKGSFNGTHGGITAAARGASARGRGVRN